MGLELNVDQPLLNFQFKKFTKQISKFPNDQNHEKFTNVLSKFSKGVEQFRTLKISKMRI